MKPHKDELESYFKWVKGILFLKYLLSLKSALHFLKRMTHIPICKFSRLKKTFSVTPYLCE